MAPEFFCPDRDGAQDRTAINDSGFVVAGGEGLPLPDVVEISFDNLACGVVVRSRLGLQALATGRKLASIVLSPARETPPGGRSKYGTIETVHARARMGITGQLQVENRRKGFVYPPHLVDSQDANRLGKPVEIDGSRLVAHNQGLAISYGHGRPETGFPGIDTGEGDDPRTESEPTGLQHDRVPLALILVSFAACRQSIDLTSRPGRPE